MQDWKIAVLVVIVVVFVALASVLLFLLYRYGHWRRLTGKKRVTTRYIDRIEDNITRNTLEFNEEEAYLRLFLNDPRLHPSPHVLYFIDFQGELLSLDFKKKPLDKVKSEAELQHHLVEAFHPTLEEANRVHAVPAEMLALSYVDDRQALVVMDINRLLQRDADFGARMVHTGERPLLLSRLVADGEEGSVYTTLSRFGYRVGAPPLSTGGRRGNGEQQYPASAQLQQNSITVDVGASYANPMALPPSSAAVPPSAMPLPPPPPPPPPPVVMHSQPMSAAAPASATSVFAADVPGMAPPPIIHPTDTHHITTSTPITITAASYTVLHANGQRTVLSVTDTAQVESARLRWDRRQSLIVPLVSGALAGYQCVIDPVTESANLYAPHGGGGGAYRMVGAAAEPVVCQRADALQYTVERVNSTHWLPLERAFFLPAGRWCVRARTSLYRDNSSKTSAKVFTVNVL